MISECYHSITIALFWDALTHDLYFMQGISSIKAFLASNSYRFPLAGINTQITFIAPP